MLVTQTFNLNDLCLSLLVLSIPFVFVTLLIRYSPMTFEPAAMSLLTDPAVRVAIPDLDLGAALLIETLSFDPDRRQSAEDLIENLNIGCHVAVYESPRSGIVGYIVFFVKPKTRVEIVRFAVLPLARRCGIGDSLVRYAIRAALDTDCDKLVCDVPEDMLHAHLLLKSVGFRYAKTLSDDGESDVPGVDMYRFQLSTDTLCPVN